MKPQINLLAVASGDFVYGTFTCLICAIASQLLGRRNNSSKKDSAGITD